MLGVCFVFEIMKSFLRSLYSMPNNNNKSNSQKKEYCQGNSRPEWCTDYRVKKKRALAAKNLEKYENDRLAGVSRPDTNKTNAAKAEIGQRLETSKERLKNAEAELVRTQDPVIRCITSKTAAKEYDLPEGQNLTEDDKKEIENTCMGKPNETKTSLNESFFKEPRKPNKPPTFFKDNLPQAVMCDKKCQQEKEEVARREGLKATLAGVNSVVKEKKNIESRHLNLFAKFDEKEKEKREKEKREKEKKEANTPLSAASESAVTAAAPAAAPAAGGARKSRKHKRTRKHMRKHTRKHKVMKSKMTKSKSKKEIKKKEKKTKGH